MTKLTNPIYDDEIVIEDAKDKLIVLENPDKTFHEHWYEGRHVLDIIHPFRLWVCGRPNSGKGLVCKNIIANANPPFDRIIVLHCAKKSTKEWDDVVIDKETDIIESVPDLDFFYDDDDDIDTEDIDEDGKVKKSKSLFIIDDFNLSNLDKKSKLNVDRILGYISTHCGWSTMILHQDLLQTKVCQRRMCNVFILYKLDDIDSCAILARKIGLKRKHFMALINKFKSPHDFVMIDRTSNSPMPIRVNGYHKVILPKDD